MQKIICKKLYDTENSELIKKYAFGEFGSVEGYEESLYKTNEGLYFIYTNGGSESKYSTENISRISAKKVEEWLKDHE